MTLLLALMLNVHAGTPSRLTRVTGGPEQLERLFATYRDRVGRFQKGRLAERREEVRRALEHAGCAYTLSSSQADLFNARGDRRRFETTTDAQFLLNLLSDKWGERRSAYPRLVQNPPKTGEVRRQTFYAVFALIEAELRSDFVRMFLHMQPSWPADFTKRLLNLAAHGSQADRRYVVKLIQDCEKEGTEQVRRTFHLERAGDLQAIIDSDGARLFGHGFRGAAEP